MSKRIDPLGISIAEYERITQNALDRRHPRYPIGTTVRVRPPQITHGDGRVIGWYPEDRDGRVVQMAIVHWPEIDSEGIWPMTDLIGPR